MVVRCCVGVGVGVVGVVICIAIFAVFLVLCEWLVLLLLLLSLLLVKVLKFIPPALGFQPFSDARTITPNNDST